MKYIVESRVLLQYEEIEAESPLEAVMTIKRTPDLEHNTILENAEVFTEKDGHRINVLYINVPRIFEFDSASYIGRGPIRAT